MTLLLSYKTLIILDKNSYKYTREIKQICIISVWNNHELKICLFKHDNIIKEVNSNSFYN